MFGGRRTVWSFMKGSMNWRCLVYERVLMQANISCFGWAHQHWISWLVTVTTSNICVTGFSFFPLVSSHFKLGPNLSLTQCLALTWAPCPLDLVFSTVFSDFAADRNSVALMICKYFTNLAFGLTCSIPLSTKCINYLRKK